MPLPTYIPRKDVVATELDASESVLLDLRTGLYYSLNDTASRIWHLLREGRQKAEIAAVLTKEWNARPERTGACTEAFLQELLREGLVEAVDPEG